MSVSLSLTRQFRLAVEAAVHAPSVHNTQPWRFVIDPDGMEVHADSSRRLAMLDPTGRQMHISLGCAILNARVCLAATGVATTVSLFPERDRRDVVARITVDHSGVPDANIARLEPQIIRRQTNRRRFEIDAPPGELTEMLSTAAAAESASLIAVEHEDHRAALARLSQRAETTQITNPAYRAELRAWTTNDPNRRDGVRAAVVPHVDGTAQDEVPIRDFDSEGAGWLPAETRSTTQQCFLVLCTESDSPLAWLQAGQALERVWLELTAAGYVASLFTQVVEVPELRSQLRESLTLGAQPHVVLRVGKAVVAPSSMRRRLHEVVDDRTGMP